MNWSEQCAVVVPCLNEELHIAPLVKAIRSCLSQVIVVDDGSTDRTAAFAEDAGACVIRHAQTAGKGAALMTGWRRARAWGFQWILNMDGDGQHPPEDIPNFLRAAETSAADLIIGNRMSNPRGMPWSRILVNRWLSRRLSRAAGRDLPDTQCGFRLMRVDAWSKLPMSTTHFEIESELTLAFARARYQIEFVPIRVIYRNERSKIQPLRDTIRWFRWWRHAMREINTLPGRSSEIPLAPRLGSETSSAPARP